jgi:hypothetical protein
MAELPPEHLPLPVIISLVIVALVEEGCIAGKDKKLLRTSRLTGHQWVQDVITSPNPIRCHQLFRMKPQTFKRLCQELKSVGLSDSRHVTVDEQLGIFLYMTSHDVSNRLVQETFQHSGETIHRYLSYEAIYNL